MLTSADTELVRRDPHLPGLGLLLDADALPERLAPLLPSLRDRKLIGTYLRYKPGTNCLAAYRLMSAGGDVSPNEPIQLYAKAFRSNTDPKFLKEVAACKQETTDDRGPIILPDAAITVRLFPDDDRLRAVRDLVSTSREKLLRKLLPERPEFWEATPRVISYKPERRCVLRLDGSSGSVANIRCYAPREFGVADTYGFQSAGSLQIPQRLGRSRRHKILAFEWVAGRPLDELVSTHPTRTMHKVGEALAEFHLQNVQGLHFRTRRDETRELKSIARSIGQLCPDLARRCRHLTRWLIDRLLELPPMVHPIHGDFYTEQVLVSGDDIVILDLDEAVFGDPAADLGNFAAHLDRQVVTGRLNAKEVESLIEDFLSGHQQTFHVSRERVDVYRAASLLRLVTHPFRSRHKDWPEQVESIITRTEKLLPASGSAKNRSRSNKNWSIPPDIEIVDDFGVSRDPKLGFVASALDPQRVIRRFQKMLPHLSRVENSISLRTIRVVRHKPGRRCLIEYEFDRSEGRRDSPPLTLIGKACAKRPDLASYRIQQTLFSRSFHRAASDGIVVPQTLGIIPEWHMWLQMKVRGDRVTQHLETHRAGELAGRVAETIHKLHRCDVPLRRCHAPLDELRILHERLPKVTHSRREWRKPIRRILDACDRLVATLPDRSDAVLHRDFYPDQLLIDGDTIALLDLDLCCKGDPALDLGNFHAHLTEYSLRRFGNPDALSAVQETFVDQYSKLAGEDFHSRIQAYATLTLVRHIYISTLIPDRRHATESLIELSARRLDVRLKSNVFVSASANSYTPLSATQ